MQPKEESERTSLSRRLTRKWYRPWPKWLLVLAILVPSPTGGGTVEGPAYLAGQILGVGISIFILTVISRVIVIAILSVVPTIDWRSKFRALGEFVGER